MAPNKKNFSAPKRASLPTISGTQNPINSLINWQQQLAPAVTNALPAPTPQNFGVTNSRGGLQLTWSPIPNNDSVDGFEILKSQNGSFTDDLQVIPVSGGQQSSFFDSMGGGAQTAHYRIRATSGTASNPQSVRGPDSGVVSHTSIDSGDTTTKPSTRFDQFTTDATRSQARKGNYGITSYTSSLGQTGGAGSGSGAGQSGGSTNPPTPSVTTTFDKIGTGENTSATMTVGEGASIGPDDLNPGVINATEINGIPILPGLAATTVGKVPVSQGDGTAIFVDPVVQGVYADGASVASPGTAGDLSTLQPVLVAGKNASGNMQSIPITTNGVKTDGSAVTQPISAVSLPLPSGASTETTLAAAKADLDTLAGAVSSAKVAVKSAAGDLVAEISDGTNIIGSATHPVQVSLANTAANATAVKVDGSAATQPISAASLPLPTGAATSANQTAGNTSLSTLAGTVSGSKVAVSQSVPVPSFALASPAVGAEATITIPSGTYRLRALLFRLNADATVANRVPDFIINDSSGIRIYDVQSRFSQTASVDVIYQLVPLSIFDTALPSSEVAILPIPPDLLLTGGATLSTSTPGLQAGDQWVAARAFIESVVSG